MPPLLYQGQHQSLQNRSPHASTFISGATPVTSEQQPTCLQFITGATPVISEQEPTCLHFYIRGNTSHFRTAAHMPPLLYQGQHQLFQNRSPNASTFMSGATTLNSEHSSIDASTLYQGQHQLIQNSSTHASTFISGATPVNSEQQHTCLHFYIRGNTS